MHRESGTRRKLSLLVSSLFILCFLNGCTQSPQLQPAPIPLADLDGDGGDECLQLKQGSVRISGCEGQLLWQSPPAWDVKEAILGDLNRDGMPEVTLLVWRPFELWPVDRFMPHGGRIADFHDRDWRSCHVILIGWKDGAYDEIWAGSALAQPLSQLSAADWDDDGWQELLALEGSYGDSRASGALTVWEWLGFGFSLTARLEGTDSQVIVEHKLDGN